jgi:hypothetical protein
MIECSNLASTLLRTHLGFDLGRTTAAGMDSQRHVRFQASRVLEETAERCLS